MRFPGPLRDVQNSKGFKEYLQWEQNRLESQSLRHSDELAMLQKALAASRKLLGRSPVQEIEIVISPIKCVYSADYHLIEGRFIFSSGRFSAGSVIHESLHPALHPVVLQYKDEILSRKPRYDGVAPSYYLNGSSEGYLNAFEEQLVRTLTEDLISGDLLPLEKYLSKLLS